MKLIIVLPFFVFNFYSTAGFGQKTTKNYLGLSLFTYEQNSITINQPFVLKFVPGIEYERSTSLFKYKLSISYGLNEINDDCRNCADQFYGQGKLSELIAQLGIKYLFFQNKTSRIKPFIELNAVGTRINYSGIFSGGISGAGFYLNRLYESVGMLVVAGLDFKVTDKLKVVIQTYTRAGVAKYRDINPNGNSQSYENTVESASAIAQLKIGYLF